MPTQLVSPERLEENLASNTLGQFEPFAQEIFDDPYPVFDRYRNEDPVHWGLTVDPRLPGCWYVFRYEDNVTTFQLNARRPLVVGNVGAKVGFDPLAGMPESSRPLQLMFEHFLVQQDPPDHTRVRRLINKSFTPRRVAALAPRVEQVVDELVDDLLAKPGGKFDLVEDFAFMLPIVVIAELLDVPVEDREKFRRWSQGFMAGVDPTGKIDEDALKQGAAGAQGFLDYFGEQVERRRLEPGEDIVSGMVADAAEEGDGLRAMDILAMCGGLVVGGHETTMSLMGTGIYGLVTQPDQLDLLREDIDGRIDQTVEELLRWVSPLQRPAPRWVYEDVEAFGQTIKRGEVIQGMIGAANHDPAKFPDPERINIMRQNVGEHLAFGKVTHFCLGAPLARLEAKVGLKALVRRLDLRLDPESPAVYRRNLMMRGISSLPMIA